MPQKLALLAGANPRVFVSGPIVRLYAGNWSISVPELKDSKLVLERKYSNEIIALLFDKDADKVISGDCTVQFHLTGRGTEPELNAFAELLYELDSTKIQR